MSKPYKSTAIGNKYRVFNYLSSDGKLKEYQPNTVRFTKENLEKMMILYSTLYVKPIYGNKGKGIYKITRLDQKYKLRSTRESNLYSDISSLYKKINAKIKKSYIIQQGITLELVEGRPYDIRAMVQRKPNSKWTCTGIFCKVGSPKKIVTNYAQGGKLKTLDNVFNKMKLSSDKKESRKSHLKKVALDVARLLNSKRSGMYEMGIDFAYDRTGKLWILEVNSTEPQFFPLKRMNPSMYNRILSYARSYGRRRG